MFQESLTLFHLVEHGESAVCGQGSDVEVTGSGNLLCKCRQLMEVSGKQAERLEAGGNVLWDRPGQTKAIVCGCASAQFINDDKRILCGWSEESKHDMHSLQKINPGQNLDILYMHQKHKY